MNDDLLALATDVDRLFRARQDGRQMPVGAREQGFREPWVADAREWNAYLFGLGVYWWRPYGIDATTKKAFRTRRHVAILALTEPEHFRRCLAIVDGIYVCEDEDEEGNKFNICAWTDLRYGKVDRVCVISKPSDIARTAAYLADLSERLRLFRETEAVQPPTTPWLRKPRSGPRKTRSPRPASRRIATCWRWWRDARWRHLQHAR